MTKTEKILFWVVTVIVLLALLGVGLFYWKKNKDIKDMQTSMYNNLADSRCSNAARQKAADCVVDKLIQKYGYIQAKEKFFEGNDSTATDAEKKILLNFETSCLTQNCPSF
jgi:hypothetical protein